MKAAFLFFCPCHGFYFASLPYIFYVVSFFSLNLSPSEHQNHAREVVKKADLSQWDALVIMSGDGLLFEVRSLYLAYWGFTAI